MANPVNDPALEGAYDAVKALKELDTLLEVEAELAAIEARSRQELAATRIDPQDQRFWCLVIAAVLIPFIAWIGLAFVSYQSMNPFERKKVQVDKSGLGKRAARRKANATGTVKKSSTDGGYLYFLRDLFRFYCLFDPSCKRQILLSSFTNLVDSFYANYLFFPAFTFLKNRFGTVLYIFIFNFVSKKK